VGGKNADGEFVLVDIEDPIFIDLGVVVLSFEFVVAETAFDVAVADSFDRSYPVLEGVEAYLKIADEILVLGVDGVYLTKIFDEMLGKENLAGLSGWA
jgi:hypothetical protein